jgi:hypothetical protein
MQLGGNFISCTVSHRFIVLEMVGSLSRMVALYCNSPCICCTTGFEAFAESEVPLGEGGFPLVEGFTERKLSAKASRRRCASEGVFAESMWDPSRRTCAERST